MGERCRQSVVWKLGPLRKGFGCLLFTVSVNGENKQKNHSLLYLLVVIGGYLLEGINFREGNTPLAKEDENISIGEKGKKQQHNVGEKKEGGKFECLDHGRCFRMPKKGKKRGNGLSSRMNVGGGRKSQVIERDGE